MAVFIPEEPYEGTKSEAEAEFFYRLKRELDLEDAYVFHSVKLPAHSKKIFGEADFIIVCRKGVVCLEVKGGSVSYKNGIWEYADRYGNIKDQHKNPFKQADDNIIELRNVIKDTYGIDGPHIFAHGVVFPDIHFEISTVEYDPRLVCDLGTDDINAYINGLFEFERGKKPFTRDLRDKELSDTVRSLRRDFTFVETLSTRLEKSEKRIIRLTNEQAKKLEELSENEHIAIKGGAGTGKTVLAEEYAKKAAKEGKKVYFIAYNKNLVRSVKQHLAEYKNIEIFNIHAFFDKKILAFDKEKAAELKGKYYDTYWPEQCSDILSLKTAEELEEMAADVLIIDEAQDILNTNYILVMDMMLKGGFSKGRWAIFYDARQNIYNKRFEEGMSLMRGYGAAFLTLGTNCRNTKNIASYNSAVTDTELLELNDNSAGDEIEFLGYSDISGLKKHIDSIITLWNKEGVDKSNVVFLSPVVPDKSDLSKITGGKLELNILNDSYVPQKNVPVYSTIHAFKGLDSPIAVLVDADKIYPKQYKNLLYTAISRAKSKLYIIAENETLEKLKRG